MLTPMDLELRMRRFRWSIRSFSAVRASCISSICSSCRCSASRSRAFSSSTSRAFSSSSSFLVVPFACVSSCVLSSTISILYRSSKTLAPPSPPLPKASSAFLAWLTMLFLALDANFSVLIVSVVWLFAVATLPADPIWIVHRMLTSEFPGQGSLQQACELAISVWKMLAILVRELPVLLLAVGELSNDGSQGEQALVDVRPLLPAFLGLGCLLGTRKIDQTESGDAHPARQEAAALVLHAGCVARDAFSAFDDDLDDGMTSRAPSVELRASRPTGLVAAGNNAEQLSRALDDLFLERAGVDSAFAVLPELDLFLLHVATEHRYRSAC